MKRSIVTPTTTPKAAAIPPAPALKSNERVKKLLADLMELESATERLKLVEAGVPGFKPSQVAKDCATTKQPLAVELAAVRASVTAAKMRRQHGKGRPGSEAVDMAEMLPVWQLYGETFADAASPLLDYLSATGDPDPTTSREATREAVRLLRSMANRLSKAEGRTAGRQSGKLRHARQSCYAQLLDFALAHWLPNLEARWPGFAFLSGATFMDAARLAFGDKSCPDKTATVRLIQKAGLKRAKSVLIEAAIATRQKQKDGLTSLDSVGLQAALAVIKRDAENVRQVTGKEAVDCIKGEETWPGKFDAWSGLP